MNERVRELIGALRLWVFMHGPDDQTPFKLLDEIKDELEANDGTA